jgi:hypothetical protein
MTHHLGEILGASGGHVEIDQCPQLRLILNADARNLRDRERDALQFRADPEALSYERPGIDGFGVRHVGKSALTAWVGTNSVSTRPNGRPDALEYQIGILCKPLGVKLGKVSVATSIIEHVIELT